ncbi:hypothetical protein [Burkholderia plantarii]|uniref:hypothetical protein n=1 Tax=Burkholderia plantarii TaxID=41899 RepID=UPI0011DFCB96|nr:hypothetical protein [Burkholderia plantarii]
MMLGIRRQRVNICKTKHKDWARDRIRTGLENDVKNGPEKRRSISAVGAHGSGIRPRPGIGGRMPGASGIRIIGMPKHFAAPRA